MAKNSKANCKNFFKHIRCGKPARKAVGLLDKKEIKRKLTKNMKIAKK